MSSRTSNGSRRASAARLLLVGALPLLVSSCVLRLVVSTVTVDTIGEEVDLTFEISAANVTAGVCRESPFSGVTECRYFVETVDGASQRTSTASLVSDFGLFGVLIDPLIVQVPAGTSVDRALVEDGVTVLDLVVTETECFEAEPGVALTAEAGQKLLIFEFPDAITSSLPELDPDFGPRFEFDVQLSWRQATAPVQSILSRPCSQGGWRRVVRPSTRRSSRA